MKKIIKITYDTLQSESGVAIIEDNEIFFQRIKVKGNFLVIYEGRNGFDMKGRVKDIFDLNEHKIEVD